MGQLHFLVPHPSRLTPQATQTAYVCGRDYLPFLSRIALSASGQLTVSREEDESGTFNILWSTLGHGV